MIPYEYNTIVNWGGLNVTEPVTVFTDFFVSSVAFFICHRFKKHTDKKNILLWNFFFFFIGLSSLTGAFSHGLKYYISEHVFVYLWLTMQILTGVAMFFAQRGTIETFSKDAENEDFFKNAIFFQLIGYIIAVFLFKNFIVAVVITAISLLPIMIKNFGNYFSSKSKSSLWLAIGIAITFLPAIVNGAKLSIGDWFNYKDISHLLIAFSISVMAYGVLYKKQIETK